MTEKMKKLLSLPPHLVERFHDMTGADRREWFCASDPEGVKVGSGGGTVSLIDRWRAEGESDPDDRMIIVHACGESRRLPAYAPVGKALTPVPVFRWASGQTISQTLLSLQMPLYEEIMENAPHSLRALIASGDVLIRAEGGPGTIPEADVVCYGIWVDAELASHHGVFVIDRDRPDELAAMLQKPTVGQLGELASRSYFLMDIGVWLLSDRALDILSRRAKNGGELRYYDLYSDFGCALGHRPTADDPEVNSLTVAVLPMPGGEFYHFGTSAELVSSTRALQSIVADQRFILHNRIKPSSSLFTQNSRVDYAFGAANSNIWIENSCVGRSWKLTRDNIVTGVPDNDWAVELGEGQCLDIVPIGESDYAVRPYGFHDKMRGRLDDPATTWMNLPAPEWFAARSLEPLEEDIQNAPIFPVVSAGCLEAMVRWMTRTDAAADSDMRRLWLDAERLSANGLTARANLRRMAESRRQRRNDNIVRMAENHEHSVFYQLDLKDLASEMKAAGMEVPGSLPDDAPVMKRARNSMLRFAIGGDRTDEEKAFDLLRRDILDSIDNSRLNPRLTASSDQIIWSRSPVRIDFAGGWTDTPPYSITNGANVVNVAVELNGQPPLQAFIKSCREPHILLRSIDMSASETITDYAQLTDFHRVGSPFSIPKAALALAGFDPHFSPVSYPTLRSRLEAFGSGIELTLLSAVPAGSGLGTSSILASTVLAAISDFAGLAWDKTEICRRTLALEQLLTTGGGWQDQFGGVLSGVKLLQTSAGLVQNPVARWLPDRLFTDPQTAGCHLLYYTGITRVAKNILSEIVRGMFLNSGAELRLLDRMKGHALEVAEAIQRAEFERFGRLIARTWQQNQRLDSGTNPAAVKAIIDSVADRCLGLKLPGAGGGGFIYMVAKDPEAAASIKEQLTACPPNPRARFVDLSISQTGLQTSRS